MNTSLTEIFENHRLDTLQWRESSHRITAKEYITPSGDTALYKRYHGLFAGYPVDPDAMGDSFSYELYVPDLGPILFKRYFVMLSSDSIEQFSLLQIDYGGYLRRLSIDDTVALFSSGLSLFNVESKNCALSINETGKRVIDDLLSQKKSLCSIKGMRDDDNFYVYELFETFQKAYVANTITLSDCCSNY